MQVTRKYSYIMITHTTHAIKESLIYTYITLKCKNLVQIYARAVVRAIIQTRDLLTSPLLLRSVTYWGQNVDSQSFLPLPPCYILPSSQSNNREAGIICAKGKLACAKKMYLRMSLSAKL
jgi:hypothetical protein